MTNHIANQIHFKPDFLPTKFVSDEFDEQLLSALANAFAGVLERHAANAETEWNFFLATLKTHGLLELKIPTQYKPDDLRIAIAGKGGEKREVTYVWKEPLAFGFEYLTLPIERARLSEPGYADEAAKILAYLFAWKLLARGLEPQDVVILRNLNRDVLEAFLRAKHAGEVSTASMRLFLLERAVRAELDSLQAFDCFDRLKEKLGAKASNGSSLELTQN